MVMYCAVVHHYDTPTDFPNSVHTEDLVLPRLSYRRLPSPKSAHAAGAVSAFCPSVIVSNTAYASPAVRGRIRFGADDGCPLVYG
jgi:hypothetical protein